MKKVAAVLVGLAIAMSASSAFAQLPKVPTADSVKAGAADKAADAKKAAADKAADAKKAATDKANATADDAAAKAKAKVPKL